MLLAPFFQTPDTSGYMIAGYIVFISLPILFIVSLLLSACGQAAPEATAEPGAASRVEVVARPARSPKAVAEALAS